MNRLQSMFTDKLSATDKVWLITGVAGFIGSNLLEFLLQNNQNVVGLDNFSTGARANLDFVCSSVGEEKWRNFRFVEGDITQLEVCRDVCKGVNIVLHQAALGSVPRSFKDPVATNAANVDGFLNMLVAAKDFGVERFVYASSSSVYGDHPALPKVESTIGNQLSPYAVSKYLNELYANVFSKMGLACIGLRYFNVFGARQAANSAYAAVIPLWISNLLNQTACVINGDGSISRDFCYIDNVVEANILAALSTNPQSLHQVYNVACGDKTSLSELFALIREQVGRYQRVADSVEQPVYGPNRSGDIEHSLADVSKAARLLGYRPLYSVRDGLERAVKWYCENRN